MKFFKVLSLLGLMLISLTTLAQKVTLSGYIRSGETGEELIGATVFVKEKGTGTAANIYGFYSVSLPPELTHLNIHFWDL
ncbi:carboxypeptidase-like regulatory domain-containing protein [bacterium SCSIO 12741]|nr:carboxypeptidase-like regulatory domain-containing protein [bacterium SCSIO 12741]